MRTSTLKNLEKITPEEQAILDGEKNVKKDRYSSHPHNFKINSAKMLQQEQYLAIRPHTRFLDFPLHSHEFIEIMYVCRGSITHVIEGKEIRLEAGDMIFLNQYVSHAIKKASIDDMGINFMALPQFFDLPLSMLQKNNPLADFIVNTLRKNTMEAEYLVFRTRGNVAIENLMENIVLSFFVEDADKQLNQLTMGMVFLQLLHNMEYLGKNSSQSYDSMVATTILQYIEENYQNASLSELARRLNSSESALSKLIKRNIGSNFKELLVRKRLQKAVALLAETNLNIADIMSAVGYENSSYFYNQFKERYQMSPRDYRIKFKNEAYI